MEPKTELQKNAIADARRHELGIYQRALDVQWMNDRMEDGRMGRCLALIKREADMEKEFQERTDHAAIVNAAAAKEIAMGLEVAKVQREESSALQRRHYIRERDPTLKELARKLQAGYVCRDLQQQILQNQYRRLQEKAEDKQANDCLRASLHSDVEALQLEQHAKRERSSKYGVELRQQVAWKQREMETHHEDALIQKKIIENIMKNISDEDARELQKKREQVEKTKKEMQSFKEAQDALRKKQKEISKREELEIQRQQQAMSDRNSSIIEARQRRQREKEESNARIAAKTMAKEASRQERENLILLLQEQEYLEKNIQDDITEREKLQRVKRETKQALTDQMDMKNKLIREQKDRELEFRRETEAKMAADEQREREKQLRIREKNRKHCSELLLQADNHRQRAKESKQDDERRAQLVNQYHDQWQSEVKEERKKIVTEHVPHLLGYLQAGVVKTDDLPAIRDGANKHPELASLNIDALTQQNRPKRFAKCNQQCMVIRKY